MPSPAASRLRFLIVLALLPAGMLRAQTTVTYTDAQTDATSLSTTLDNPLTLTIDDAGAVATQSGLIFGAGSITMTGAGTLVISDANIYTGGTVLDDGTLGIGNNTALGTGTLTINGGNLRAAGDARTLANAIILNGDFTLGRLTNLSGPITLTDNITITSANPDTSGPNTSLLSGVISGAYGLTFIDGANPIGTIILSGDNTYTGGTTLSSGTLQIGNGGASGSIAGDILDNGTLTFYRSDDVTYAGAISGSGSLIKYGTNTLTLSGNNTYTGGTTLNGGIVNFTSLASFGSGSITLNNGSGLQWADGNTADVSSRLIIGDQAMLILSDSDVTFASAVSGTGGNLLKFGAGTLTLSGLSNIVSFAIAGGAVVFAPGNYSGSLSIGDGESAIPSPTAATLSGAGITWAGASDNLTVGNSNEDTASFTLSGGASASFNVTSIGSSSVGDSTFTVSGAGSTFTNASILYIGLLSKAGLDSLVVSDGASVSAYETYLGYSNTGLASLTLTGAGSTFTNSGFLMLALNAGDNGTLNLGSAAGDTATASGILNVATVAAGNGLATLQFNTTGTALAPTYFTRDGTATGAGISTTGNLALVNTAGTTVITGTLRLGGTTINGGTLQIGNGGTAGSITGNILDDSSLVFDLSGTSVYSGAISGTGTVTQSGTGIIVLTGANTYSGGTLITSGLVAFTSLGNFGTGPITLNGGGLEWIGATDISSLLSPLGSSGATFNTSTYNVTFATALSGSGSLTKSGSGSLTLSGDNTYSGSTLINAGSIVVSGTLGSGNYSGAIAIANTASLNFSSPSDQTFSGIISGAGSITQSGSGTLTLSGINTYSGNTTVSAGTFLVNSYLTDSAVTVNSGATLGGNGTFGGLATLSSGAHLALGNASPGTITFAGGLTLNGGSVLDLRLGTTSDLIVVSGGTLSGPSSGTITVNLTDSGGFTAGTYTLIDYAGDVTSDLVASNFVLGSSIVGYDYSFSLDGDSLLLTATAVPEPAAFAALAGGLALGLACLRRRRRSG